jgi:hypothetical protein
MCFLFPFFVVVGSLPLVSVIVVVVVVVVLVTFLGLAGRGGGASVVIDFLVRRDFVRVN